MFDSSFRLTSSQVTEWAAAVANSIRQKRAAPFLIHPRRVLETLGADEIISIEDSAFEAFCTAKYNRAPWTWTSGSLRDFIVPLFRVVRQLALLKLVRSGRPIQQRVISASPSQTVTYAIAAVTEWVNLYRSDEAEPFNWMVPGLSCLLHFLGEVGLEADLQSSRQIAADDETNDADNRMFTEQQERVLNAIRQHIGKFRGDSCRPAGYVVLMTESIQGCITLGNIQMASAFLKTVESSNIDLARVPIAPRVAFKFYLGKLYMQQEKFAQAEEALAYALSACSSKNVAMKKSIVECLTPVRLRLGLLPPEGFLDRYNMVHYKEIVKAMRLGNAKLFEKIVNSGGQFWRESLGMQQEYTGRLVDEGTLLVVERLKFIVYRTLFARTLEWARERGIYGGSKGSIVPLSMFTAAFGWQLSDDYAQFDDEEMACIVSHLIKLGYVKGYIAWNHGKIVLAKTNPLPAFAPAADTPLSSI